MDLPLKIQEHKKKELLLYVWKIENNRRFILKQYLALEKKVNEVRDDIGAEINQ